MAQDLNEVQRDFVNETCRPMIEQLVRFHYMLALFVDEADNQQTPIVANAEELNDADDGLAPRSDAPVLTGDNIASLRTFAANMRDQISVAALNQLIALSVRNVTNIVTNRR